MSGTSLVILAMYSTVNVVSPHSLSPETLPYLMALLMAAAALTCTATLALYHAPRRAKAKGATLSRVRRFGGPGERRL
ncbi:MAG: hypothetical protein AB7F78_11175 [Hyphomicrobiaceae bacterium]